MPSHLASPAQADVPSSPHRRVNSVITNASAIADSTISYASMTTEEEMMRLSQFPRPPSSLPPIPASPLRSEWAHSPAHSLRTLSPPATPRGGSFQPSSSPALSSIPLYLDRSPTSSAFHGLPHVPESASLGGHSSEHGFRPAQGPGRAASPPGSPHPVNRSARNDNRSPSSPHPNLPSISLGQRVPVDPSAMRPDPPQPPALDMRENPRRQSQSSSAMSPYDWHEGSSSIGVEMMSEDHLSVSTSFITGLLTTTGVVMPEPRIGAPNPSGLRYTATPEESELEMEHDTQSNESEITYPPITNPELQHMADPRKMEERLLPPGAYQRMSLPRDDAQKLEVDVPDADNGTMWSESEPVMVVRNASMVTPLGPRGIPVIGMAPATFHHFSPSVAGMSDASSIPVMSPYSESRISTTSSSMPLRGHPVGPRTMARPPPRKYSRHSARASMHSTKTVKSQVSSVIDRVVHSKAMSWLRKPLPPVPTLPSVPIAMQEQHKQFEESLGLPHLLNRAGELQQILDRSGSPRSSHVSPLSRVRMGEEMSEEDIAAAQIAKDLHVRSTSISTGAQSASHRRSRRLQDIGLGEEPHSPKDRRRLQVTWTKRKKIVVGVAFGALVVFAIVAIAIGVSVSKHHKSTPKCSGNLTGGACDLDATCVCTSPGSGQCAQLAQSLITLTPVMNRLFNTNYTTSAVSNAIWEAQGAPTGANCQSQALLVDVGPALDSQTPNRTQWAQSALLWNLVQSHDLSADSALQKFVEKSPWNTLGSTDGPVQDSGNKFSITQSGYQFDFAAQTVVAPSVTFQNAGQPSADQLGRLTQTAESALNRMYSFATASSTQRSPALAYYWQSILQQKPSDLSTFLSAVASSPILLPFDATFSSGSQPLSAFLTNSSSQAFPPPIACYPGLNGTQFSAVNNVETTVFDLTSPSPAQTFDTDCFANRPIYGVLDLLQLRLPFPDSRRGVAGQAAALKRDVSSRAVIYSGELLSALPDTVNIPTLSSTQLDPRQYGTLNNMEHVLFNYFNMIANVTLATALVNFVLSSPVVPPANNSVLAQALGSLPALEVAVFGSVLSTDVQYVASSFSTPSGSLFFGSDQALATRDWTINAAQGEVRWTNSTSGAEVVHDNSLSDSTFNEVWTAAFNFLHEPNNANVGVVNITSAFNAVQKYSP